MKTLQNELTVTHHVSILHESQDSFLQVNKSVRIASEEVKDATICP